MNKFFYVFLVLFLWVGTGTNSLYAQNGLNFDGTDDYVNLSNTGFSSTVGTVEFWVKSTASGSPQMFVDLGGEQFTIFSINSTLYFRAGGTQSTASFTPGNWNHLALSWSGGVYNGYLNGALVTSGSIGAGAISGTVASLGRSVANGLYMNGTLDEVRFWNYGRSTAEIANNRYAEVTGGETGLLTAYLFNQGTASGSNAGVTTLNDVKGSNNGTLSNFALTGATSNWVTGLSYATALSFDGTDDYVNFSNTGFSSATGTMEFWAKSTASGNVQMFMDLGGETFVVFSINNTLYFRAGSTQSSTAFTPSNWNHIALTWSGGTYTGYLNGTSVVSGSVGGSGISGTVGSLGRSVTGGYYLNGTLEETRIWSTARTASELSNNASSQLTGNESGLLRYYRFNQGLAAGTNTGLTSLLDISTTANNGTLSNFALTGATSNWVASGVTITTTVPPSVSIAITTGSQTTCANASVIFTATPTNGGSSPTYQWKKNGVDVGTGATYGASSWATNDVISCIMTSNAPNASPSTATSNSIVITVSAPVPVITGATTGCGSVTLTASGGTNYQWSSGQNSANGATFTTSGTYTVTVTDNVTGCTATKSVDVTVNAAPSVTLSNTGANNFVGTAALSVNSTTATDIKWYNGATLANTSAVVSGVAVNTYTPTTAGSYTAVVTVNGCMVTTNAITVDATVPPSVSIAASASTICAGTSVTFTATPTNGGTPTYVWQKNGNTISGEVSSTYTTTDLANGDIISCVMTSSLANASPTTATSNSMTMTVNALPSVTLSNTGANSAVGTAVLSVNSTTASDIKWYNGATLANTSAYALGAGTTVAGGNGQGSAANQFDSPDGVYLDATGNMYIVDALNNRIQKWTPGATIGTTVAGGNGVGSGANQLFNPSSIYVDANGNVYIADRGNARIQKWAAGATSGTTVAGGNGFGSAANQFNYPVDIYVDADGNMYIPDINNHRIQKWAAGATTGTTVAGGNGRGSAANQFTDPVSVYVDAIGNMYIIDQGNHRVQKWAPGATSGTTVAGGNGRGSAANQFSSPLAIYVDGSGNMYIADYGNHRIQKWASGATSGITVAGGNGAGMAANQLNYPIDVYVDGLGNMYIADQVNHRIQKWTPSAAINTYTPTTTGSYTAVVTVNGCSVTTNAVTVDAPIPSVSIAASATTICAGTSVTFTATPTNGGTPTYVWQKNGSTINGEVSSTYTTTSLVNGDIITCVMTSSLANASPTTVTSNSITINSLSVTLSNTGANTLVGTAVLSVNSTTATDIKWYNGATLANTSATVATTTTVAGGNGQGSATNQLNAPTKIYVDAMGNMYIADRYNHRIQKWTPGATSGTTVAGGNGAGSAANQLNQPTAISVDATGNMYIADNENHRIQKWAPGATSGTTVAGGNGSGSAANQLRFPSDIYVDATGNIYIADASNSRIQKWAPGATTGTNIGQVTSIVGIYVDGSGNVYASDQLNYRIVKFAAGSSTATTVAGGNGPGSAANRLSSPYGIFVDATGNIYIADANNNRIQKWAPGATTGTTVAGGNGQGLASNQLTIPFGIFVDATGTMYIADGGNHRIQKAVPVVANTYTPTTAGSYTAVVTVNGCSVTTNAISVITPPTISIAITSGSQNMCEGAVSSVTFTATSTNGGTTPQYQWKKNGNDVGTNSTTYTDAALANGDIITCVLTSSVPDLPTPTVTSNSITIAVTPLPSINTVSNQTVCVGTATTAVAFSGTGATSYTWTNNNTAIGLAASGTGNIGAFTATNSTTSAITATITVTPKAGAANCAGTPTTFTITVNPNPAVYAVTGGGTSCDGSGVAVGLSNSELGVNYQLKRGGVNTGSPVAGTGSAISFGNQTTTGIYTATAVNATTNCVINMTGSANVENNATTLTPSVAITANPSGAIYTVSSVTFTATPTTGGTTPQYQWQKNGANVGNNSATYTNNSWTNGDVVTCILTSNHPCAVPTTATSNSITISATAPPVGAALNFDGSNDYVNFSNTGFSSTTGSMEFWAKSTSSGNVQMFIDLGGESYVVFSIGSTLYFRAGSSQGSTTFTPSNWNHIALTWSGGTYNGYLNGTLVKTGSVGSTPISGTIASLGRSVLNGYPFNGTIDEVRIWSTARTASEIANGRSCELAGNETGLISYYKFNQGAADLTNTGLTTLTDGTANANNGTLSNFALTGATSNWVSSSNSLGAAVTPSVSITASPSGAITTGTSVTFTATPTNGGAAPTYVWKKGGVAISGEVSATYTSTTLANGDIITCEMTSNATCATTATATSTGITMTVSTPCSFTPTNITVTSDCLYGTFTPDGSINGAPAWTLTFSLDGHTYKIQWNPAVTAWELFDVDYLAVAARNTTGSITYLPGTGWTNLSSGCTTPTLSGGVGSLSGTVTPSVSIAASPSSTITTGTSVTFTATPTHGGTTPTYVWKKGGIAISGEVSSTYTSNTLANGDIITCEMTSNATCTTTALATSTGITMSVMCIGTKVAIKVFLEGAYNSTTGNVMNTTLKTNNLLPLTEPYTGLSSTMSKFTHIGGGSEAATTLNSNIVDWVFVELYTAPVSPSTTPTLVATKSVLLRADGQVVDAADQSKVYVDFSSRTGGDYIVGVRHRNHLAVITDNVITLTCDALSPVAVDFTTTVNPVSTSKMNVDNNVTLMRAGELNGNDSISALDVLKARQANTSGQTDGYKLEDVNMSGQATATDVLMTRKNNKSN